MNASRLLLVAVVVVLISVVTVASLNVVQYNITSRGMIHIVTLGVEAFWDENCTNPVTDVDWGILEPSDAGTVSFYLKNTGNTPVILSMTTQDWTPSTSQQYLSLAWDAENATITEGAILGVKMTLSVSPDISGTTDFEFTIVITGGEA